MAPGDLEQYWLQRETWDDYDQLQSAFEWEIPDHFNLASVLTDQWSERETTAIFAATPDCQRTVSFAELQHRVNKLANFLAANGIGEGDKVGISAPQIPETLITHLAAWKLGAVSVPTSVLFGQEALRYRFVDANIDACIAAESNIDTVRAVVDDLSVTTILTTGVESRRPGELDFSAAIADCSPARETVDTAPEDPCLIIYTSGTTGQPKGVVHGHQMLLGQLPHFACSFCNLELHDTDVFYAPIEWSWIAMFNFIVPALFYGRPLVAYAGGSFDPAETFELLERYAVTCFGVPPTALRKMKAISDPAEQYDIDAVRVVETGGEALNQDIVAWASEVFGATIHENYGQTEADVVIGDCTALGPRKQGSMGRVLPGHEVSVVDPETLEPVQDGETGELAVRYVDDPVCFINYLHKPQRTAEKVQDGWLLTGDLAAKTSDGYYTFKGRSDDIIISAGYRIDPTEIEETLTAHAAVRDAGVVGVSHEERGEVPKAFVVVESSAIRSSLESELEAHVKQQLALYDYPREWEFLEELPTTITGKTDRSVLKSRTE